MISSAAVLHLSAGHLFEHLGVRLVEVGHELEVRFANGESEMWTPAPDGYPLDGSLEFIEYRGRYFIPADRGDC